MKHLLPIFLVRSRLLQKTIKVICLMAVSLSFLSTPSQAQEFDWVIHFADPLGYSSSHTVDANHSERIISDATGNVYIIGTFCGNVDFDPGSGYAWFRAVDDRPHTTYASDYFFSKYDAEGRHQWTKQLIHTSADNRANLAIDSSGYVYLSVALNSGRVSFDTPTGRDTFETSGGGVHDGTLFMKYDTAGNFIWAKMITGIGLKIPYQRPRDVGVSGTIAVDPGGSVYLAGEFKDTVDFDPDPNNSVLLTTSLTGRGPGLFRTHFFLAKYDTDGNFIWVKDIQDNSDSGHLTAYRRVLDILVSKTHDVYITGYHLGSADFDPSSDTAVLRGDPYSNGVSNNLPFFLAKYDSNGNYLWAKGGAGCEFANGGSGLLAEDALGNVYATGEFYYARDFDPGPDTVTLTLVGDRDIYLTKYTSEGQYIWAKNFGGSANYTNIGGIALNNAGNICMTGTMLGLGADFDPCTTNDATVWTTGSGTNAFIAQFDPSGNYLWAGSATGASQYGGSTGRSIAVGPTGNIYTTGTMWHFVDFDPSSSSTAIEEVKSPVSNDWYIWKLNFNDTVIPPMTIQECDSFTLNGIVYTTEGAYSQFIPSADGCSDTTIHFNLVLNDIEKPIITVDAFLLGVHKPYASYQWLKDGAILPGATGDTFLVTENGDYQVVVSGGADCVDTSAVYRVDNTAIDNPSSTASSIRVYPNPVDDVLYIQATAPVDVLLTDIAGRKVMELQHTLKLPTKGLPAGVYMLQIKSKEGPLFRTVKVVKQ